MSSTLDPDTLSDREPLRPKGHDVRTLGPSDSSDSGSDVSAPQGVDDEELSADTDRYGTGEHASAGSNRHLHLDEDISADRIVSGDEAGLGAGLDEAEEALLGITDEDLPRGDD